MKIRFTSKAMIACGIGACLFVTTAFADMMLGSGYDKLKTSLKHTSQYLATSADSFSVISSISIKLDEQNILSGSTNEKYDNINARYEIINATDNFDKQNDYYMYKDADKRVTKNSQDNQIYVTELDDLYYELNPYEKNAFHDPFQEEDADEIEKIVDAVVGNLQDIVLLENGENDSYSYSGSLNSSQVPAIVNAVASYALKKTYNDERRYNKATHLPELSSDITIQAANINVTENKAKFISSLNAELVLSGKDTDGVNHQITASYAIEINNINTTTIEEPDVSNAIVQSAYNDQFYSEQSVGTYKNNIVIEESGKIIKIGERTLQIDAISIDSITGSLEEVVYEGYEDKYSPYSLTFTDINISHGINIVEYVDEQNVKGTAIAFKQRLDTIEFDPDIIISQNDSNGSSWSNNSKENYNSTYTKIFE